MRGLLSLTANDLRLLTRDPMGLFFIAVFPALMGLFFGFMFGAAFDDDSEKPVSVVALVDHDATKYARRFADALEDWPEFELEPADDFEAARGRVRKGQLLAAIELPAGFGETAGVIWRAAPKVRLTVDPSRGAEAMVLKGAIMQGVGQLVQERFTDPVSMRTQIQQARRDVLENAEIAPTQRAALALVFNAVESLSDALADAEDAAASQPATAAMGGGVELVHIEEVAATAAAQPDAAALASGVDVRPSATVGSPRTSWDISLPSAMLWGLIGCAAQFALTIVRERTQGTLIRLQVAPLSRAHVLAGKALAALLTALAAIALLTMLGLLLGMRIDRPDLFVLAALCTALCFVGLTMIIAVIGKTEEAVAGGGWAIMLVLAMFGGAMVPLAFMPAFMQRLSSVSPVKWGIYALEGAIWRGFSFSEMLVPCGVLLAVGGVAFSIGATIFTRQRTA